MSAPAGRSVKDFLAEVGLSNSTFHALYPESRPRYTRIGGKLMVIESPAEWLARIAAAGGARTKRQKPKPLRVRQKPKAAP